ncbi:hypothetical protein ZWY2020_042636 [Hordeum vulgare]|nr:hypothetical protein ZWY2020_042636 [Hordeum vulgare]
MVRKKLIKKLANFPMFDCKRTRVIATVYKTFHFLAQIEHDVIKLMDDVVDNIKLICELVEVGVVGTIYVVGIVARDGQQTIAIHLILGVAFK